MCCVGHEDGAIFDRKWHDKTMISLILFDLDGTIIDSEPAACQAILDMCKKWNLAVTREDAASVAGKKWEVAVDLIHEKFGFPMPPAQATREIVARYREILDQGLRTVPGVIDAIQDFSQHFKLGLVSGSHRAEILWALTQFQVLPYFSVILGAEDYPQSKPAPDGYAKALKEFGVEAEHALVFEDSAPGIASAKAAGIKVVAISSTNHFGQKISDANQTIPDFKGIDSAWVKANF